LFQLKICSTFKLVLILFSNLFQNEIIKNRKKNWRSSLPGPAQPGSCFGGPEELLRWKRRIGAPDKRGQLFDRTLRGPFSCRALFSGPPIARPRARVNRARQRGVTSWAGPVADSLVAFFGPIFLCSFFFLLFLKTFQI
jgi:hypothetical protein